MKKVIIILIIIIIVILGIYLLAKNKNSNTNNVMGNQLTENDVSNALEGNDISNDVINNVVNTVDDSILTNDAVTSEDNYNVVNNESKLPDVVIDEDSISTDQQKAIDIAKKAYGTTDGANFSYDGQDGDGKYIVRVTRKSSGNVIQWYHVDTATGKYDIEY